MSFASRLGLENRDSKLKLPDVPMAKAKAPAPSADLSIVACLQADLKAAHARIAELEAQVAMLTVNKIVNAPVNKEANSDRKAYMREYMRKKREAKKADARQS